MSGLNGLKSIARERAEHERDRLIFEAAHDSTQVSDMFLSDENEATSSDAYDESMNADILNSEEAKALDKLIDELPEATDDDDNKLVDAILNAEDDLSIEELYSEGEEEDGR